MNESSFCSRMRNAFVNCDGAQITTHHYIKMKQIRPLKFDAAFVDMEVPIRQLHSSPPPCTLSSWRGNMWEMSRRHPRSQIWNVVKPTTSIRWNKSQLYRDKRKKDADENGSRIRDVSKLYFWIINASSLRVDRYSNKIALGNSW